MTLVLFMRRLCFPFFGLFLAEYRITLSIALGKTDPLEALVRVVAFSSESARLRRRNMIVQNGFANVYHISTFSERKEIYLYFPSLSQLHALVVYQFSESCFVRDLIVVEQHQSDRILDRSSSEFVRIR